MAPKKIEDAEPAIEPATEDGVFRMGITIDQTARKNMRIAAALADLTVGEWAAAVLQRAADKQLEAANVG